MKTPYKYHLIGRHADGRRINRKYKRLEPCNKMMRHMTVADCTLLIPIKYSDIEAALSNIYAA